MAGVRFTPEAAELLGEATRHTLANRSIDPAVASMSAPSVTEPYTALCTSATADARGNYPGVVTQYVARYSALLTGAVCKLRPLNGQVPTADEEYVALPCGTTPDGDALFRVVVTCCPAPGGPGGGVAGIHTGCADAVIPATIYATVTGGGSCNGTYAMQYNGSAPPSGYFGLGWSTGPQPGLCSAPYGITLYCGNDGNFVFQAADGTSSQEIGFDASQSLGYYWRGSPPGTSSCCTSGYTVTLSSSPPVTGGGGGGGTDCFAGLCGSGSISGTLTATPSGATGCFTGLPSSWTLACNNDSTTTHRWLQSGSMSVCGLSISTQIFSSAGLPYMVLGGLASAIANAGYACYPFAAVFYFDDGTGNTVTVTVSG